MAGRPGAVEKSVYRKEIEEMIQEGKPDQFISDWLKGKGAPISRQTINKYRNTKFNITLKAREKYNEEQSRKRLDEAVDEQVDDIKKIDSIIAQVDPDIVRDMDPKDQVRSVSQLLNTKYKILGVIRDDKPVTVNLNLVKEKGLERLKRIEAEHHDSDSTEPTGCAVGDPPDPPE